MEAETVRQALAMVFTAGCRRSAQPGKPALRGDLFLGAVAFCGGEKYDFL